MPGTTLALVDYLDELVWSPQTPQPAYAPSAYSNLTDGVVARPARTQVSPANLAPASRWSKPKKEDIDKGDG
jgi:hypothetical protein